MHSVVTYTLMLFSCASVSALRISGRMVTSRRDSFGLVAAALLPSQGCPGAAASTPDSATTERQRLIQAIDAGDDGNVADAMAALLPLDPSGGKAATSEALAGEWRLLWSENTEAFSPLLSLPRPVRPASFQLLGDAAAARGFGSERVANLLCFPFGVSLQLSSGVRPATRDTLEIFPPFRLELAFGGARQQLVEAGSDAEFRALNARDADAQAAPRNLYLQQYLETSGAAGDLRISKVVSGDPVIVGSVFIHERVVRRTR